MLRSVSMRTIGLTSVALGLVHGGIPAKAVDTLTLYTVCTDRPSIVSLLDRVFGEGCAGAGLGSDGQLYELFVTAGGATWTSVGTDDRGVGCVIAVGEGWERPVDPALEPVQHEPH